ncbi:MAG: hypothetical protein ACREA0_18295, partial [bacterium]
AEMRGLLLHERASGGTRKFREEKRLTDERELTNIVALARLLRDGREHVLEALKHDQVGTLWVEGRCGHDEFVDCLA